MPTLNTILKELNDVPVERLEELSQLVHSMTSSTAETQPNKKKILSFAGSFSDMSKKDYSDFQNFTKNERDSLFNRTSLLLQ
ncbi:MAG: hypothetical protein LCH54_14735 [Bacteroidetes bacterium]|nr:hypothetical protein [Bacteroidota bacterium]